MLMMMMTTKECQAVSARLDFTMLANKLVHLQETRKQAFKSMLLKHVQVI